MQVNFAKQGHRPRSKCKRPTEVSRLIPQCERNRTERADCQACPTPMSSGNRMILWECGYSGTASSRYPRCRIPRNGRFAASLDRYRRRPAGEMWTQVAAPLGKSLRGRKAGTADTRLNWRFWFGNPNAHTNYTPHSRQHPLAVHQHRDCPVPNVHELIRSDTGDVRIPAPVRVRYPGVDPLRALRPAH